MLSSLPESLWRHSSVIDVNAALRADDAQWKRRTLFHEKKHAPQNSHTFGCCSTVDRRRSVFGNNKSWSLLLACFTFTGNSCQQECSLSPHLSLWGSASLLVSWVLHTTTSCKQAGLPSPLPSSTSDLWRSPSDLLMHQNNYFELSGKGHCYISPSGLQGQWPPVQRV